MAVEVGQIYRTKEKVFLKVKTVRESGLCTMQLLDDNLIPVEDVRNTKSHIVLRAERFCTVEIVESFKRVKNGN